MDALPALSWGDLGAGTLAFLFLLLLFRGLSTGAIVTRREADNLREERDYWRQTAEKRSEQFDRLLDATHTPVRFIEAVARVAGATEEEPAP